MNALRSVSTPCWPTGSWTKYGSCARGDLHADLPSMRCVGYRQAWELLDAPSTDTPFPLARLRELGIAATRQLAKRQITWLRSMPERLIVPCDHPDALAKVLAQVDHLVAQRARP